MTRVWPALCPPWKRTTSSARSESQSTILPLPSSPHWAPITATFAIGCSLFFCGRRFELGHGQDLAAPPEMRAAEAACLTGDVAALGLERRYGAVAVLAQAGGDVGGRPVGHVDAVGRAWLGKRAQDGVEIKREAGGRLLRSSAVGGAGAAGEITAAEAELAAHAGAEDREAHAGVVLEPAAF